MEKGIIFLLRQRYKSKIFISIIYANSERRLGQNVNKNFTFSTPKYPFALTDRPGSTLLRTVMNLAQTNIFYAVTKV